MAREAYTYEDFLENVRKGFESGGEPELLKLTTTENGQKTLRSIYEAESRFHRDITVLSSESVDASFKRNIIQLMNEKGYQEQHVDTAIAQLKAIKGASELTEEQKTAWTNLLDRLGKKGSTMRDVVVVLGMILSQSLTGKNLPSF